MGRKTWYASETAQNGICPRTRRSPENSRYVLRAQDRLGTHSRILNSLVPAFDLRGKRLLEGDHEGRHGACVIRQLSSVVLRPICTALHTMRVEAQIRRVEVLALGCFRDIIASIRWSCDRWRGRAHPSRPPSGQPHRCHSPSLPCSRDRAVSTDYVSCGSIAYSARSASTRVSKTLLTRHGRSWHLRTEAQTEPW